MYNCADISYMYIYTWYRCIIVADISYMLKYTDVSLLQKCHICINIHVYRYIIVADISYMYKYKCIQITDVSWSWNPKYFIFLFVLHIIYDFHFKQKAIKPKDLTQTHVFYFLQLASGGNI